MPSWSLPLSNARRLSPKGLRQEAPRAPRCAPGRTLLPFPAGRPTQLQLEDLRQLAFVQVNSAPRDPGRWGTLTKSMSINSLILGISHSLSTPVRASRTPQFMSYRPRLRHDTLVQVESSDAAYRKT